MTQWTLQFKLIDDNGNVTSRIIARYDDESLSDVQARFAEFLRGCGYHVPDLDYGDPGTEALIDELRNRIAELESALYYVMDDFEKWPGDISKASWDKAKEVMREAEAREAGR